MARKKVIPDALADALTADKPSADTRTVPAARAVSVLAGEGVDDVAAKDTETLAAEIIALQIQGNRVLLAIGRRLIAAKEKLSHGDWLPWLESVNIPERLAQRYMKLAREWTANPTILSDLGMSKALTLLALPETERNEFIAEGHVVDGEMKGVTQMSNAELAAAIQARKDAEARLADAEERLKERDADYEAARKELFQIGQNLQIAQYKAAEAESKWDAERKQHFETVDKLTAELTELKAKPVDVAIEKVVVADEAAIEQAKDAVRAELEDKVKSAESAADFAKSDADTARQSLSKVRADLDKAKQDAETARINEKVAKEDTEKARQDAEAARKDAGAVRVELDHARAELERVRADAQKSAALADSDLALFGVLYEQVKSLSNQMTGIMLKRSDEKRESMKKALLSIAKQIKEATEA